MRGLEVEIEVEIEIEVEVEDLLLDVLKGDRSLFLRFDEVENAWKIVDPILQVWATERDYVATYPAGSWGPEDSRLFDKECQGWRTSLTPESSTCKVNSDGID